MDLYDEDSRFFSTVSRFPPCPHPPHQSTAPRLSPLPLISAPASPLGTSGPQLCERLRCRERSRGGGEWGLLMGLAEAIEDVFGVEDGGAGYGGYIANPTGQSGDGWTCTYCRRKGHGADNCYTKQREQRTRGGRKSRIEALEEELRKLKAEEEAVEEEEDMPTHMAKPPSDSEEEGPEPFFMASEGYRGREDMGLRSGGADGRRTAGQSRRGPRLEAEQRREQSVEAAEQAVRRARAGARNVV
ncbi:unnamed protein product [Closterium sp. NIES-64]|nr:unnamed protein product [Closterium sp. NIES-64]